MIHAATGKAARVRSNGLPGNDCVGGACRRGPAEGGRAASRSIFSSCSLRRVSCSPAPAICSWACASCLSAGPIGAGLVSFGVGVEFIGVSLHPMSSEGRQSTIRRRSVQSCPKNGRMMVEHGIGWRCPGSGGMLPAALLEIISRRASSRWYPRSFQPRPGRLGAGWRGYRWAR